MLISKRIFGVSSRLDGAPNQQKCCVAFYLLSHNNICVASPDSQQSEWHLCFTLHYH